MDRVDQDAAVTYGRIEEFSAGQKIVVDVDNAPDKSFDLTGADSRVNVAAGLMAGDPVKITERDVNGARRAAPSGGAQALESSSRPPMVRAAF